ncbi:MAG: 50S ribosomal protein L25 [Candidatus Doudnabacteria bacterium]|nr:50S ribosomal protein L25 [Candidatus Doudnabacteria bacterium]
MEISLTATKRTVKGKANGKLRKAGKLPAVLYGHKVETSDLELNEREFAKVFKLAGESTLVNLSLDGQSRPVLIHDVQNHYLNDQPIHVDFYAVNMNEKLKATVPLHFEGEAPAVKALGGILLTNISEVEVECLPADLPHAITVDIGVLNTFDDAIHISDLKVADKVEILGSPDEVVASVSAPRTEAELASLSEKPVVEDVTQVEGVVKPEAPGEENKAATETKAE